MEGYARQGAYFRPVPLDRDRLSRGVGQMAFKRVLFRLARFRWIHQTTGIFSPVVMVGQTDGLPGNISHTGERKPEPVKRRIVADGNRECLELCGKSTLDGCMACMELQ